VQYTDNNALYKLTFYANYTTMILEQLSNILEIFFFILIGDKYLSTTRLQLMLC